MSGGDKGRKASRRGRKVCGRGCGSPVEKGGGHARCPRCPCSPPILSTGYPHIHKGKNLPLGDLLADVLQAPLERLVLVHELLDPIAGGDGRGMIRPIEEQGDALIGQGEHVVAQVHGDLPGHHHLLVPPLGHEALEGDVVVVRHDLLDPGGVHVHLLVLGQQVLEGLPSQSHGDGLLL